MNDCVGRRQLEPAFDQFVVRQVTIRPITYLEYSVDDSSQLSDDMASNKTATARYENGLMRPSLHRVPEKTAETRDFDRLYGWFGVMLVGPV